MMEEKIFHMGANYLLKVISGKWKVSIICALRAKDFRYLELLKYESQINNAEVSKKVLTEQLNQLEHDGIITKQSYGTVPPKVIYSLTTFDKELSNFLVQLNYMGEKIAANSEDTISFDISAQEVEKLHQKSELWQ